MGAQGVLLCLTVLTGTALGQLDPHSPIKTSRISGRLVDIKDNPILNGTVTLRVAGFRDTLAEVETGKNGVFTFPSVLPKTYELHFEVSGYDRLTVSVNATGSDVDIGAVVLEVAPIEGPVLIPYEPTTLPKWLKAEQGAPSLPRSSPDSQQRSLSCSQVRCRGKRFAHTPWGLLEFCVPRGIRFRRVVGFEGDIHDRITIRVHGELNELVMFTANATWGPVKSAPNDWPLSAPTPGDTIQVRQWQCPEGDGYNFRFSREGRHWRMVAFPAGFAEYKNVSSRSAEQFDRVLDSLCCKRFTAK